MNNQIIDIVNFCKNKNIHNIYLFPHKNPDADALGACCALSEIFNKFGFYSKPIIKNAYNDMKGLFNEELTTYIGSEDFLAIICDCSSLDYLENNFYKEAAYFIKIDHHEQTIDDLNKYEMTFVDTNSSSTCEIVTFLLKSLEKSMDNFYDLNPKIYDYLYYGILTDTGKFTYAINKGKTFYALSWLIKKGAHYVELSKQYSLKTETNIKINMTIFENMNVYDMPNIKGKKIAICEIPQSKVLELDTMPSEFSKAVNLMSDIENVDVWCVIVERKKNVFTCSLRSCEMSTINVEKAVIPFNGGGHYHSSGCSINGELKETFIDSIINIREE